MFPEQSGAVFVCYKNGIRIYIPLFSSEEGCVMKKIFAAFMSVLIILAVAGCSDPGKSELEGSLTDIMNEVYEGTGVTDWAMLSRTEITSENISYYFGTDSIEITEGLASEPMISSQAHSVCLIRVPDGTDIDSVKQTIKEKADPRKWICVGVDEKDVYVENIGNTIILIMDSSYSEKLRNSFLALAK